jgi:TfoX N-terminal domain
MAYDEALAARVRKALHGRHGLGEKKMFGGVAFMLDGNMCCGITGPSLFVRLAPTDAQAALAEPHTRVFDMSGRPMKGWVVVTENGLADDGALARWVGRGAAFAATLPAK